MSNTTTSAELNESTEQRPDGGGRFTWFLWGGAAVTLGLACSLPFADRFSWKYHSFGVALAEVGLGTGVLFLAGFVYLALALVGRAVRASAGVTEYTTERITFLTEELTTQMALVRSGQNRGQTNQEELRQVLARVGAEVAALATKQGESSSDGLFRLAASLDHLTARVEEGFDTLTQRVEERLGEFATELDQRLATAPQVEAAHDAARSEPRAEAPRNAPPMEHSASPMEHNASPVEHSASPVEPDEASVFEPDAVDEVEAALPSRDNPFDSIDLEHQPAMEFLDSMEEEVERGVHRGSTAPSEPDFGPSGAFSIDLDFDDDERRSH
ncbi:MAG: hypothetical protein WD226_01295 [Planctomycetota bacterium]